MKLGSECRTLISQEVGDSSRAGMAAITILHSDQVNNIVTGTNGGGYLEMALNRAQQLNFILAADTGINLLMSKIDIYCQLLRVSGGFPKRAH